MFASEIDREARFAYTANFGSDPPIQGDITEIDSDQIPAHDVLTAGFPCQPFSSAGGGSQLGFEDDKGRGMLFMEIVRVLRARQPKAFLLENVANLTQMNGGRLLAHILEKLRGVGYQCKWRLINSRVLMPQQRSRVYIVGFRAPPALARFHWPVLPVLTTALRDVLEPDSVDADPRYILSDKQFAKLSASPEFATRRVARLAGCARTLMGSYRTGGVRSEFVLRGSVVPRYFTLRECARLQGFPEDFLLSDAISQTPLEPGRKCKRQGINPNRGYQQLGNAVSPVLVAAIASSLLLATRDPVHLAKHCLRRQIAPALNLLKRCHPHPDTALASSPSLSEQCRAFLEQKEGGPAVTTGTCPDKPLTVEEERHVRKLLSHRDALARVMGLHAVKDTAHRQFTLTQRVSRGLADMLSLVIPHLNSDDEEVSRLSVVALGIMSRDRHVARTLSTQASVVQHLRRTSGERYHALAEQALGNILKASKEVDTSVDTT